MVNFLSYCLFGLLSFSVLTAEAARTVIVQPGELLPTYGPGVGPDAFIDSRDWNATISDQKGTRHTVPVVREKKYSWPSFRGALKNALKLNPGQLLLSGAVTGAVASVGWLIDENSQITRVDNSPVSYTPTGSNIHWLHEGVKYPSAISACQGLASRFAASTWGASINSVSIHSHRPYTDVKCAVNYSQGSYQETFYPTISASGTTCPTGLSLASNTLACVSSQALPITDSDIDSFISGISDPSFAASSAPFINDSVPGSFDYPDSETFGGPNSIDLPGSITTTTNPTTGDTTVVESLPSIQLEYGTSPLSITSTQTTVTNTYQNGTQTSTSVSTETNTSVETPVAEIPTDCDFMPTVCSFIDWVKTPFNEEEPDLSEFISDEDFEREINFSSNASCPGPSMIATSRGTYEFSWEPACQWAGLVKPLVIIAALIAAIFINLGMARGNE
ncbi:virulence factor TspB C-terminal domain-related protein [Pseudomonas sp.]|uniref:virulence factor TspB C-terminal domain-related protein n=1 Tax=Pseudomonas sp. TaxID=306 RepID=UPI002732347E|nr:virulence factor TspB C-terminal domain-related protein [Pseudomonas sp.]MDP2746605.1 virulence factor TspB C-terminal domain-related protein [Pseudomonas sp.]